MRFQIMARTGFLFIPCIFCFVLVHAQSAPNSIPLQADSATRPASTRYYHPSLLKRVFLGKNYRSTWATPVTLPVFHMKAMGFKIKELGGGQQTKSLHLEDKNGVEWALRSIDKEVEKALPAALRNSIAETVTQDMVSGAYPYAPLIVYPLARATGVVASAPQFFFVPADPDLKPYDTLFQNSMCLLENREPPPAGDDTKNTEEFLKDLLKNHDITVNQEAVLRARLLDMLIGDWDRHQDQWRWGFEKVSGNKIAFAIPRDRDQALFFSKGLLVKLARAVALKHLVGFAPTTKKLKQLNAKSWNFDRAFLNGLDENDWHRIIAGFVAALPDTLLENSVRVIPPEVYARDGKTIAGKLRARRNGLLKDAIRYYKFIAENVTLVGSDAHDRFVISPAKDSVLVQQFGGKDFSKLLYSRSFQRHETGTISIFGLGKDDTFEVTGEMPAGMRLLLDGGAGSNSFQLISKRRIKIQQSDLNAKSYLDVMKKDLRIKD